MLRTPTQNNSLGKFVIRKSLVISGVHFSLSVELTGILSLLLVTSTAMFEPFVKLAHANNMLSISEVTTFNFKNFL
jgi:hypothetical protein